MKNTDFEKTERSIEINPSTNIIIKELTVINRGLAYAIQMNQKALEEKFNIQYLCTLKGHSSQVLALDFSPQKDTLISVSADFSICLGDLSSMSLVQKFLGHENKVLDVKFLPDSENFVSFLII